MPEKKSLSTHLVAGGAAGFVEAVTCHPLDTIKVRMQLRTNRAGLGKVAANAPKKGFIATGVNIAQREGALSLYKGLGAVVSGIVPKMAIRFSSFEFYKGVMAGKGGKGSTLQTFLAGLGAGITEAVMVVTPMEVIKIRLQAQRHSMMDPLEHPKYRNAGHAAYTIVKEEGISALYKGVTLTALRQATNQAVNFTAYQEFKKLLIKWQPDKKGELPSWQHLLIGGISGAFGPMSNAPIDTIKTRIQRAPNPAGESGWTRFRSITSSMIRNEGYFAFYKGLTPRLLRVAPGQAITFMVYERVRKWIEHFRVLQEEAKHDGKTLIYFKR